MTEVQLAEPLISLVTVTACTLIFAILVGGRLWDSVREAKRKEESERRFIEESMSITGEIW